MSKVYITQEVKWRDPDTGQWQRRHDFSPANRYGELVVILPTKLPNDRQEMLNDIRKALKDFTKEDYILPAGFPVAISASASIASYNTDGLVNFLEWNNKTKEYTPIHLQLWN